MEKRPEVVGRKQASQQKNQTTFTPKIVFTGEKTQNKLIIKLGFPSSLLVVLGNSRREGLRLVEFLFSTCVWLLLFQFILIIL